MVELISRIPASLSEQGSQRELGSGAANALTPTPLPSPTGEGLSRGSVAKMGRVDVEHTPYNHR
jgi:hypothetical protein